tara:strand:+ start:330 stop:644 length:315 start_codon:yes stop_codon:yes gene_type:complete
MGKRIVVYTLPHCHHCQDLKGTLNFMRIPHEIVDAQRNTSIAERIEKQLNTASYPIIEFPSDSIFNSPIFLSSSIKGNVSTSPNHRIFDTIDEAAKLCEIYYKS